MEVNYVKQELFINHRYVLFCKKKTIDMCLCNQARNDVLYKFLVVWSINMNENRTFFCSI